MIIINFQFYNNANFDFDVEALSNKIAKTVFKLEKINEDISFNVSIVSNFRIKKLNSEFRNINKNTDVLSFPSFDVKNVLEFKRKIKSSSKLSQFYDFDNKTIFIGDVIICYNKIISQSKKFNHSIKREYSFLLTHSILHLIGYDHISLYDEMNMNSKQEFILNSLKIYR